MNDLKQIKTTITNKLITSTTIVIVFASLIFASAAEVEAGVLYWSKRTNPYSISKINTDGTGETAIVTGLEQARSVALDLVNGKVYYSVEQPSLDPNNDFIQRANLDGTGVETIISGLSDVEGIYLDASSGKIYYADQASDFINRADLDGSNIETIITDTFPTGVAVDLSGGKIYWSNFSVLKRADLDGTNEETLVTGRDVIAEVELDLVNGKVYWSDTGEVTPGTHKIERANLDGTGIETLLDNTQFGSANLGAYGIALDIENEFLYFGAISTPGNNKIERINFDGTGLTTVASLSAGVNGLAFDPVPEPATILLLGSALFSLFRSKNKLLRR